MSWSSEKRSKGSSMLSGLSNLEELSIEQLQELAFELDSFFFKDLRIGEPYAPIYRSNRKAFKTLVRRTVRLRNNINQFFNDQLTRLPQLVNIHLVQFDSAQIDTDPYINVTYWEGENDVLNAKINIDLGALFDVGVLATELTLDQTIGISSFDSPSAKFLRNYTLGLVRNINDTTRKRIIEQLKTSLSVGENRSQLVNRLTKVIDNPKRATMIAQTESVRAYSEGRMAVFKELGIKKKIWVGPQAQDKLCPHGEIKDLDKPFSNGQMFPPGHPNCRCGYQQADTLSPEDIDKLRNYAK
jgi:hypothetical protein